MNLRANDNLKIPLLMKLSIVAELISLIFHLIEEITDFKGYIRDYIASGEEILVNQSEGEQFKFFKHDNGWPLLQYQMLYLNSEWLPSSNRGIKLWKEDPSTRKLLLPTGERKPLAPTPMRNHNNILKGIRVVIEMWETLCCKEISGEY